MVGVRYRNQRVGAQYTPQFVKVIGLIGAGTFLYTLFTTTVPETVAPSGLLEVLLLGVPALGLIYAGFWLQDCGFEPGDIWRIGIYSVGATAIAVSTVGSVLLLAPTLSKTFYETFLLFVSTGTEAALLGVLFGVLTVMLEERDRVAVTESPEESRSDEPTIAEFAGMIGHDLRNPLNVAEGRLELAQQECESSNLEMVAEAHSQIERMIEDFLVLAQSGNLDAQPVELGAVAETVWDEWDTGKATLDVTSSPIIEADPLLLKHVLHNLIGNAVQHCDDGVRVEIGSHTGGFYVEDDGPGIPSERRDEVFDSGYTTAAEGKGYGLYIVEKIANAHGWEIDVTSGSRDGTRFEFRF